RRGARLRGSSPLRRRLPRLPLPLRDLLRTHEPLPRPLPRHAHDRRRGPRLLQVTTALPPVTGSLVHVRQRTYLVERVAEAPLAAPVVSLACVDDDAQGQKLDVVWTLEPDARVLAARTSAARADLPPDDARTFAAYLLALRWGAVTSTEPDLFQS